MIRAAARDANDTSWIMRTGVGSSPGSGNVKSHSASRCGLGVRPSSSFFWRSFSRDCACRTILMVPWPKRAMKSLISAMSRCSASYLRCCSSSRILRSRTYES